MNITCNKCKKELTHEETVCMDCNTTCDTTEVKVHEENTNDCTNNFKSGQEFSISETEWLELKALLEKRYSEIASLLRYNKTRDKSIQELSSELQKYREGFAYIALKPFIMALILFREECQKSIRDAKEHGIDDEKAKKYIGYLELDFEEMLSNLGLEKNEKNIILNKKPLPDLSSKILPNVTEKTEDIYIDESEISVNSKPINSLTELVELIEKNDNHIKRILNDKVTSDLIINEYIKLSSRTDAEHYYALAVPVINDIYSLFDKIIRRVKDIKGEFTENYFLIQSETAEEIHRILTKLGTNIETLDSVFDVKKHKIIKTVEIDDESLDKAIAKVYSDCYMYDEKIIYQSKVDIYKFNINK